MPLSAVNRSRAITVSEMPKWLEIAINPDGSVVLHTSGSLSEITLKAKGEPQFIQLGPIPDLMKRPELTGS